MAGKEKYMKKQESWGRDILNTYGKENSNNSIFSKTDNKEEKKRLTWVSEQILVAWTGKK